MINLGEAPEQKSGFSGPIPSKSIVRVKIELGEPKEAAPGHDPCVGKAVKTGLFGLNIIVTVVGGQFDGKHWFEMWGLPPGMQTISITKGQEGFCNGSFAKMRAAIEAARGIDPQDPQGNRSISTWWDLHGLEFPAKINIETPKAGDLYINNKIDKILPVTDEHFTDYMAGMEIITDTPIPEIPAAATDTASGAKPTWKQPTTQTGTTTQQAVQQTTQQTTQQQPVKNTPQWAKR